LKTYSLVKNQPTGGQKMKKNEVSTSRIHDLADQIQKSLTGISKGTKRVPVEYIEEALSMIDTEGCIDLRHAEAIDVRKLVEARLEVAREHVSRMERGIDNEVRSWLYDLSHGDRNSRINAALPAIA
jgi:hypothetical protein